MLWEERNEGKNSGIPLLNSMELGWWILNKEFDLDYVKAKCDHMELSFSVHFFKAMKYMAIEFVIINDKS